MKVRNWLRLIDKSLRFILRHGISGYWTIDTLARILGESMGRRILSLATVRFNVVKWTSDKLNDFILKKQPLLFMGATVGGFSTIENHSYINVDIDRSEYREDEVSHCFHLNFIKGFLNSIIVGALNDCDLMFVFLDSGFCTSSKFVDGSENDSLNLNEPHEGSIENAS